MENSRLKKAVAAAAPATFSLFMLAAFAADVLKDNINWEGFLAKQDLVWERMSTNWGDAAFAGNGHMGAMIFKENADILKWELGHNAVTLPVKFPDEPEEVQTGEHILIGDFLLVPAGEIEGGSERMRMDLWNAETRGEFKTAKGAVQWRSFIHATNQVLAIEVSASGEESKGIKLQWRPEKPLPAKSGHAAGFAEWLESPPAQQETRNGINLHIQRYKAGGLHAVAWAEEHLPGGRRVLYASVIPSFLSEAGIEKALTEIKQAQAKGLEALVAEHRQWWHAFWPAGGFVSLDDKYWENFYWVQMYRIACAMRADSVTIDGLNGPWLQKYTSWPFWTWNLNVQLCYWPQNAANRLELGESLYSNMDKYIGNIIYNVAPEYRSDSAGMSWAGSYDFRSTLRPSLSGDAAPWHQTLGDLPWLCHNYWLHYRHSMDDERLKNKLFPLLKRAINFYRYFLKEKEDGKLHLLPTQSPELATVPDCNYDLALLRWGCETLIRISDRLKLDAPEREMWEEILKKLTPFPTDEETGLLIGEGYPLKHIHRHYSHLLAIYPLYLINRDTPAGKALAEKSAAHYTKLMEAGGDIMGFTFTGASSMWAALGNGDEALRLLNQLAQRKPNMAVNLTDLELGNSSLESTFSPVQCIHDMLIQSWGDRIRVFPALPSNWRNITIHNLRTEGAFLVSAARENGRTKFIRIRSLAGEPCRLETDLTPPVKAHGGIVKDSKGNIIELELKRGEEAILYAGDEMPACLIAPIETTGEIPNRFGLKKGSFAP